MRDKYLFIIALILTSIGVLVFYALEISIEGSLGLIATALFYLSGLATLFFGWRLIDHKFPSKGDQK